MFQLVSLSVEVCFDWFLSLLKCVSTGFLPILGTPLVAGLDVTAFTDLEEEQAGATDWVKANAKFMEATFKEQVARIGKNCAL